MKRIPVLLFAAMPVLFLLVYHRTFQGEYAYLDEAQQLWQNQDGSNYSMFLVQGRSLTGRVLEYLFGSVTTIADLRYLRLFSLAGWILTAATWLVLMRKWITGFSLDRHVLLPALVFFVCSPAVAISIGWASCAEIFIATLFGLLSGAIVFGAVGPGLDPQKPPMTRILVGMVFGVCSLFLYQNSFGIFLLPFILALFTDKSLPGRRRTNTSGIVIYLLIYAVYFLMFRYQLKGDSILRADRAAMTTDPLSKLLFFFSGPLPKAFSLNVLYNTRSILMQVIAPVLMILFAISLFIRYKHNGWKRNCSMLLLLMALLALVYLPSLAVQENFSSYRTMFAFSLTVTLLLLVQLFYFIRNTSAKLVISLTLCAFMLGVGYFNYNNQFSIPLENEYRALRQHFHNGYDRGKKQVYFIRPDKNIFSIRYGTSPVKDEFGNPSTLRDWVPEPLTRLIVREETHNQSVAASIRVIQFPDRLSFDQSGFTLDSSSLLVPMDSLIVAGK
ncbi:MAG: hypothetical protein EOO05_09195 [Chitinophagaceae bacterium]|nr:MAG: hypothetical protein EOO05_09195 [Chitinophagaceae bacterium]